MRIGWALIKPIVTHCDFDGTMSFVPDSDFYSIIEDAFPEPRWDQASIDQKRIASNWAPYLHAQSNKALAAQALLCVAAFIETESHIRDLTALEAETAAMMLPTVHDWMTQGHLRVEPCAPRVPPVPGEVLPLFSGWQNRVEVQSTPRDVLRVAGVTAKNMIDDHTVAAIRRDSALIPELRQLAAHLHQEHK